jgi:hypothetical protein
MLKLNVSFQIQYKMLCVKFKLRGYGVRLTFKVKVLF